jgi:hypothetical protein
MDNAIILTVLGFIDGFFCGVAITSLCIVAVERIRMPKGGKNDAA